MVSQKAIHEYLIKGLQFPYERNFKQTLKKLMTLF